MIWRRKFPSPGPIQQRSLGAGSVPEPLLVTVRVFQLVGLIGTALGPQAAKEHHGHAFLRLRGATGHRKAIGMTVGGGGHGVYEAR